MSSQASRRLKGLEPLAGAVLGAGVALAAAAPGIGADRDAWPGGAVRRAAEDWVVANGWASPEAAAAYHRLFTENFERLLAGLGLYLLFGLYWSLSSAQRKADAVSEPGWSTLLHRALVNLAMVVVFLPIPFLTARIVPTTDLALGAGLAIEAVGIVLAIAARRALGANWSREVRLAQDHELVRTGPYRRLRHPIYTGALCATLGLAVQSGLLSAFLGVAVLALAYWRKIALEGAAPRQRLRRRIRRLPAPQLGAHPFGSLMMANGKVASPIMTFTSLAAGASLCERRPHLWGSPGCSSSKS